MTDNDFLAFLLAVVENASTPNPQASNASSVASTARLALFLAASFMSSKSCSRSSFVCSGGVGLNFSWMLLWLDFRFAGLRFSLTFWLDAFCWLMKDDKAKGWSDRGFLIVVAYRFFLVCGCCNRSLRAFWWILMELGLIEVQRCWWWWVWRIWWGFGVQCCWLSWRIWRIWWGCCCFWVSWLHYFPCCCCWCPRRPLRHH